MKELKIKFNVKYYLPYIPQRCRKMRYESVSEDITFKVKSVDSIEAPIAFALYDYHHVSEQTPFIRCYKNKLYMQYMVRGRYLEGNNYDDDKLYPQGFERLQRMIHPWLTYDCEKCTKEYAVKEYKEDLNRYILIDGYIWERCGEPRYEIVTFGLGHNHGGTGLFVATSYNPNISKTRYFSALDGDKAVAKMNEIAQNRGDTLSVGQYGKMIEVYMPEMVKCNPHKEHGEGDKFINTIDAITENSSSVGEAGLLCMVAALC